MSSPFPPYGTPSRDNGAAELGAPGQRKQTSSAVVVLVVGALVAVVCSVSVGMTALLVPALKRSTASHQVAQSGPVPATKVPTADVPAANVPATDDPTTAPAAAEDPAAVSTTDPVKTTKIGQPVRGTTFEFTVTKFKCGVSKVGGNFIHASAQGQFCIVTLKVKNVDSEPAQYSSYDQTATGQDGVEYENDDDAEFWANSKDNLPFMKEINPGNSETGILVYDIPKGAKLLTLELFDGAADTLTLTLQR